MKFLSLAYIPLYAIGLFIVILIIYLVWDLTGDKKSPLTDLKSTPSNHVFFEGTNIFERQIYNQLLSMFDTRYVFMNVLIGEPPQSTQIDHIVLTRKAIFVIEVKDYKGKIEGNLQQDQWKQTLEYAESTPSRFISYTRRGKSFRRYYLKDKMQQHNIYNPYLQNKGHINVIRFHLKGLAIPLVNMVVFSNRSLLDVGMVDEKDAFVVQHYSMQYMLKAYLDTRPNVISESILNNLENLFVSLNKANSMNIKKHIEKFNK